MFGSVIENMYYNLCSFFIDRVTRLYPPLCLVTAGRPTSLKKPATFVGVTGCSSLLVKLSSPRGAFLAVAIDQHDIIISYHQ